MLIKFKYHLIAGLHAILIALLCCGGTWAQDIKLPADAPVKIEADNLSYDQERDVYSAEGSVVITYGDGTLSAQHVEYDRKNNLATAQGGAFLKMAEDSLAGDKIVVNLEDKTGVAYNSKVFYARNHFYISGERIEKTGENTYSIEQPVATTCDGDDPAWKIAGSSMKVTLEGYGWVKHARLMTKDVPVLYTPVIAFPAKTKRQTGFLLPYLSYSKNKDGVDIEIPFFWAINPQMDATVYSRYIEKRGLKEGAEFRYFAGGKSFGTLYGDYLEDGKHVYEMGTASLPRDWQGTHRRWSYYLNHQTNFDSEFYVRTDVRRVSDSWYFRDFNSHNYYLTNYAVSETDPFQKVPFQGNASLPFLESSARVFKGWNNYNLMARLSYRDDFSVVNNDRTLQQYPEIILTGIKQPLFSSPVYYEFTGTYDYFYRGEGQKGHYVDVAPSVSLPFNISSYVTMTPQLTVREIYWLGDRENNDYDTGRRSDNRTVVNAGVALSSRLSRVFDVGILDWEKLRHEIRPEAVYSYIPRVRQDKIAERDNVNNTWIWHDTVPDYIPRLSSMLDPFTSLNAANTDALMEQNAVAWALTNTITVRRKKEKDLAGRYLEIFRFKLFQVYDINEAKRGMQVYDVDAAEKAGTTMERRTLSDLGIELDIKPHPYLTFSARNRYSVFGGQYLAYSNALGIYRKFGTQSGWREMNYDLRISNWRGDSLTLGYRYTQDSIEAISLDLKAVITERLSGRFIARLDQLNNRTVENTVGLMYTQQCWGVGVDYTRTHDDQRIMLKISLAGLGIMGI